MTQDEIVEMAKEAGIYHAQDSEYHWDGLTDQQIIERTPDSARDIEWRNRRTFEILERFANLVAAKEKEALALPEQEPVAWVCHGVNGKHDVDFDENEINAIPVGTMLYTTPSQPEQEHFALKHRIAELEGAVIGLQAQLAQPEQTNIERHEANVQKFLGAPQRTWVGLTESDVSDVCANNHPLDGVFTFARAIEAKLKELNT